MKILILLSRFPYPLEKGDKLRAFQHIKILSKNNDIHLVALSDRKVRQEWINAIQPFCKKIDVLHLTIPGLIAEMSSFFIKRLPLQVGYFTRKKYIQQVHSIIKDSAPDLIYCQLIRTAEYIREIKNTPKVIDYQDAFSRGTAQRASRALFFLKPLFNRELKLVMEYEQKSFNWFDKHIIISEQDKEWLNTSNKNELTVIQNGIDLNYFQRHTIPEDKFDITFTGNMNYIPNIDAAIFLVRKIMPFVWKEIPGASVQIAGAHPNRKVKELASERVTVTGWVNDIRESYYKSRLFIAPMRMGTGLQNKLLEAMAMELPCITTSISCSPLGAMAGKDILVGNNSKELSQHVINILKDKSLSQRIATNGYNFVKTNFALEISAKKLEDIMGNVIN